MSRTTSDGTAGDGTTTMKTKTNHGAEITLETTQPKAVDPSATCSRMEVFEYGTEWHLADLEIGFDIPKRGCSKNQADRIAAILSENSN